MPPPRNPSSESMAADLLVIGAELRMARELLERSDSQADRRLSALEAQLLDFGRRLAELEKDQIKAKASERAVEKERSAVGEWWSRVSSWVGIAATVIAGLIGAAWALFVRGEK